MAKPTQPLEAREDERRVLKILAQSGQTPQGKALRAKIVNHCLAGVKHADIARRMGIGLSAVSKWRGRFAKHGINGLADRPRSGKPVKHGKELRGRILATLELPPPAGQACWDGPAVAAHLAVNVHAVWRLLRAEGICLQRQRSWCVSTDPEFAPKCADIVGRYLNPPLNALVISVDEKPSIQALQRAVGYVQTSNGKVVRGYKSTYKRNGTLNLFGALQIDTGKVVGRITETKRREDFRAFMDELLAELPQDKDIHVILDNLNTHKKNEDWLAKFAGRVSFHFTPTSASWLNLIEVWFGLLSRKALRGASFSSKEELRSAIEAFLRKHNENPKPFKWRKREVKGSQLRNTIVNLRN